MFQFHHISKDLLAISKVDVTERCGDGVIQLRCGSFTKQDDRKGPETNTTSTSCI
jgi:hypothetical protein